MSYAGLSLNGQGPALRVLVVDDEPMVRDVVTQYLERDGYRVDALGDGRNALEALERRTPDLIVLDVMLPSVDGFRILDVVRRRSEVPVILLSARDDEADRVLGLELGADDYVVKPFSPRELAARVRSVLRRTRARPTGGRLEVGGLIIDPASRLVHLDGTPVELTPKEFNLLLLLAGSPWQVFSRRQLLEQVWESSADWQDPSTVTVHVRRLRQKVEHDPRHPRHIVTVWGIGYRFES
ncbi:MAG TPA: response regulator transcription factor [Acidimicrobiales bacterium]